MNYAFVSLIACGLGCVAIATTIGVARREYLKSRRDRRFCELLRRVMESPEGEDVRHNKRMLKWHSCEPTSVRLS